MAEPETGALKGGETSVSAGPELTPEQLARLQAEGQARIGQHLDGIKEIKNAIPGVDLGPEFVPMQLGGKEILLPASAVNPEDNSPDYVTDPDYQEMQAQKKVIGYKGLGSVRVDSVTEQQAAEAEQSKTDGGDEKVESFDMHDTAEMGMNAPEAAVAEPSGSFESFDMHDKAELDMYDLDSGTTEPTEPTEPDTPTPEEQTPDKPVFKNISVVNLQHDVQGEMEDIAETRLKQELEDPEIGRFRLLFRRAWKGNMARGYYKRKYMEEAREYIGETGDIITARMMLLGESEEVAHAASERAIQATIERSLKDSDLYLLEGESRFRLAESDEAETALRDSIKELVVRYANEGLDDDTFDDEVRSLLSQNEGLSQEVIGQGAAYATNLLEIARTTRGYIESGICQEEVLTALDQVEIRGAILHNSPNTEVRRSLLDKLCDRVQESRFQGTTVASAVIFGAAVATCLAKRGLATSTSTALRMTGIGFLAGGVIAGANEAYAVRHEIAHVRREATAGVERDSSTNARLRRMEQAVYSAESAQVAIADLNQYFNEDGSPMEGITDQQFIDMQTRAIEMRTLLREGAIRKIDLVSYSSIEGMSTERLALMEAIERAQIAISQRIERGGELLVIGLDGQPTKIEVAATLQLLDSLTQQDVERDIAGEITEKEAIASRIKRNEVLKKALIGAVIGGTAMAVAQEAIALIHPDLTGVFGTQSGGRPNTLLATIFQGRHNSAASGEALFPYGEGTHVVSNPANQLVTVKIPEGLEPRWGDNGQLDLLDSRGNSVANNIQFEQSGDLTAASREALASQGVTLHEQAIIADGSPRQGNMTEFLATNKDDIEWSQMSFYANPLEGQGGTGNELSLAAGGDGGWLDAEGNVHVLVRGLTSGGSENSLGNHIDAVRALHDGDLKLFVQFPPERVGGHLNVPSMSFVFEETKPGWGEVVIPKGSPAAQFFEEGPLNRGHDYKISCRSLGIAVDRGTNAEGLHNYGVISSIRGDDVREGLMVAPPQRSIIAELEWPTGKATVDGGTLPVFGPPLYARRGIGAPIKERLTTTPDDSGNSSQEQLDRYSQDLSPRLLEDPNTNLSPNIELPWYRQKIETEHGAQYIVEVDKAISDEPVLSSIGSSVKAIVTIPVVATTQSGNIFQTLSAYAEQSPGSLEKTVIMLHVNWVNDDLDDPAKAADIQKTWDEIERAKTTFPQLKIATTRQEFLRSDVGEQDLASVSAPYMTDIALLAIEQSIVDGRSNGELLIVRHDADIRGMSYKYLDSLFKAADEDKTTDAFLGGLRWDTELYRDYPGYGLVTQLMQGMQVLARRQPDVQLPSLGANIAVRASSMAAVGGLGDLGVKGTVVDALQIKDKIYAARRGKQLNGTDNGSTGNPATDGAISRQPVKQVSTAEIDTNGSKLLEPYLAGEGIHAAWANPEEGSNQEKPAVSRERENPEQNIDQIVKRVEATIDGLFNTWYQGETARPRSVLALMWGTKDKDGNPLYELGWHQGVCHFKFTGTGVTWLKNALQRNTKGQFDPYRHRVRRGLYGEINDKLSTATKPRMYNTQLAI